MELAHPVCAHWHTKCKVAVRDRRMRTTAKHDSTAATSRSAPTDYREGIERRKRPRSPLRWTIYLVCNGWVHPFRTETQDISRDGFYCLLEQPLRPGEAVECDILVPTHHSQNNDEVVHFRCHSKTVRVEEFAADAKFGVACRIEDDWVFGGAAPPWLK